MSTATEACEVFGYHGERGYGPVVDFQHWSKGSSPQEEINDTAHFWRKDGYLVTIREYPDRYTLTAYEPPEFPIYEGSDGREHAEY